MAGRMEEAEDAPMLQQHKKRAVPGARDRGTGFCLCLSFFLFVSFIALSGVMLSPFFVERHPPTPSTPPAPAITSSSPEPPKPDPTPSSTPEPIKTATPSEQFNLQTNFKISNIPTSRSFTFNITLDQRSPDGFTQPRILINNQSPGPLIEANTNDLLHITVHNNLPSNGTSIHWHGIDQRNTNWMDGVHGVTQCAIPPGQSFTYSFNVTNQRGTFWYHSHVSLQYTNGLYGPIVIHDPGELVPLVQDDKILMFGDLFHSDAEDLLPQYLSPTGPLSGTEPPPDNIILNGLHRSNCTLPVPSSGPSCSSGTLYRTLIRPNTLTRLRLISHSTSTPFLFSIDNHTLSLIEIDGVEMHPISTSRVFLNPGQRYSVLLNTNQTTGNYRIRVTAARACFHMSEATESFKSLHYEGIGILSYEGTKEGEEPIGTGWDVYADETEVVGKEPWEARCRDLPFERAKPRREEDAYEVGLGNEHFFRFSRETMNEGVRTLINETAYEPLKDDAVLWKAEKAQVVGKGMEAEWGFGGDQFVMVSKDGEKGVQIVINSDAMMMHPFHLHGQQFQVVGWGRGTFGKSETTWNLKNPIRRDTVTVPGYTHVVLRIRGDNPGVWALHCHILWHAEDGMFVQIAQRMDELEKQLKALDGSSSEPFRRRFCTAGR